MKLRIYVLILLLWSRTALADSDAAIASKSEAFTVYANLTEVDPAFNKIVKNMPKIQSQDTVGSCFGCSAATMVQKYICDTDQNIIASGKDCSDLPPENLVSQFSMVSWSDTNRKQTPGLGPHQKTGHALNHTHIKLYDDAGSFSSGSNALRFSARLFSFMPESCYPFDQLVKKYGDGNKSGSVLFEAIYKKTRNLFEDKKVSSEAKSAACPECLSQLNADFNTKFTPQALNSALTKESYGEFLFELIFNKCEEISFNKKPTYKQIPDANLDTLPRSDVFQTIKIRIDNNRPVQITGLCLDANCNSKHSIVISGYRKVCPSTNYNDSKCRTQFRLHNCWGQDWQNSNNGGWVDSEAFTKQINATSPSLKAGAISWLE